MRTGLLPFVAVGGQKGQNCRKDGGNLSQGWGTATRKALYYIAFLRCFFPNTLYYREVGRFPCGRAYPSDKENDRLNLTGGSRYTQRNG